MPDYSVYVKIINDTDEDLQNDPDGTTATHGSWLNVPSDISGRTSASFQLKDSVGVYGSDGTFNFFIETSDGTQVSNLDAWQADPTGTGDNGVSLDTPKPQALYAASFRASVDGGTTWTDGYVDTSGHPVNVEYTLAYQTKTYRWTLVHIDAVSNHPVRNTLGDLIVGSHELWDSGYPSKYDDGTRGSLAPNIFAYDFTSAIADYSLNVTVQPLDLELTGAEVIVFGYVNNVKVFQTDYFFLKDPTVKIITSAHVVSPSSSSTPFFWNNDVEWRMELRLSQQYVQPVGPNTTRLELYWIATTVHFAFQNAIPVGFLRDALPSKYGGMQLYQSTGLMAALQVVNYEFYADMTRHVFYDFCKIYDTSAGESGFNMGFWGGNFLQASYRAADYSGVVGSLNRWVNCMDQAGMLELCCSILGGFASTSWLAQQPFGFINTTHLVGVADDNGTLIDVNNPFFGTDRTRALVDINDAQRTYFMCHVYVGNSKPFVPATDGIYDACGGPHTGTEVAADYVTACIDTVTTLYATDNTTAGTVNNISSAGNGVTGIDGQLPAQQALALLTASMLSSSSVGAGVHRRSLQRISTLLDHLTPMSQRLAPTLIHVDWAHTPAWIKDVLGNTWGVRYGSVTASEGSACALWHLEDTTANERPVRVQVTVESVVTPDGVLDVQRSTAATRDRLTEIIGSTDRDPEEIWTGGTYNEFGDFSLEYASHVACGRVVIVALNTVIDISGRASTAELDAIARQLLQHTVRPYQTPLVLPALHRGPARNIGRPATAGLVSDTRAEVVVVEGLFQKFSVAFFVEGHYIIAAGARCLDSGILFDKYAIDQVDRGEQAEGEPGVCMIDFRFVTRERGRHSIQVHFAESHTMVCATEVVEVEVL